MTVEELKQRLATDAQRERHALWAQGHTLCIAIAENAQQNGGDPRKLREGRAQVFLVGAEMLRCTVSRVRSIAGVVATFGSEPPAEEATYTLCRAVMATAHRLKRDPKDLLTEALNNEWSEVDVSNLGRVDGQRVGLARKCPECGGRQSYSIRAAGWPAIYCGGCIGRLVEDQPEIARALRDVPKLGALA